MKKILITGGAGFIGFFLSQKLLPNGLEVVGIDNLNDYYDPALKQARLDQLRAEPQYSFINLDLADRTGMERLFAEQQFDAVVNLAAQAGVRGIMLSQGYPGPAQNRTGERSFCTVG